MRRDRLPTELDGLAEWLTAKEYNYNGAMVRHAARVVRAYNVLKPPKRKPKRRLRG